MGNETIDSFFINCMSLSCKKEWRSFSDTCLISQNINTIGSQKHNRKSRMEILLV